MSATKSKKTAKKTDETARVLYQKMGRDWYAFSVINDEVFVGKVPSEEAAENSAELTNSDTPSNRPPLEPAA